MRRLALLLALGVLSRGFAETEMEPAPAPVPSPPAAVDLEARGAELKQLFEGLGLKLEVHRQGSLVLLGTCGSALLTEVGDACQRAAEQYSKLMEVPVDRLVGQDSWFLIIGKQAEWTTVGQFAQQRNPDRNMVQLFEKLPAVGNFLLSDPARNMTPQAVRSLAVHNTGHRLQERYRALRGKEAPELPAWLVEGTASHLDAFVHKSPRASCVAITGYDGEKLDMRSAGADWTAAVYRAVEKYKESKKKRKDDEKPPAFRGLGELSTRVFDKLTGDEVAASWSVVSDLIADNPKAYKAFVDGILGGQKQLEAFEAAFGKDIDAYEKGWMKDVLKKPPEEPKDAKGKPKK